MRKPGPKNIYDSGGRSGKRGAIPCSANPARPVVVGPAVPAVGLVRATTAWCDRPSHRPAQPALRVADGPRVGRAALRTAVGRGPQVVAAGGALAAGDSPAPSDSTRGDGSQQPAPRQGEERREYPVG